MINMQILFSLSEIGGSKSKNQIFYGIFVNNDISVTTLDIAMIFCMPVLHIYSEGYRKGGGLVGQDPPPFFWGGGAPNLIKSGKTLRVCTQIRHVLVVNSYPDPPLLKNPVSTQKPPWPHHCDVRV